MNIPAALLLCLALCLPAAALASNDANGLDNPLRQQAMQIRADLAAGDVYPDLTEQEHRRVLALLARMESSMGSSTSIDSLGKQAKVRLYNDQQELNALLTGADNSDRLVCTRTRITGSHRQRTVCLTAAEHEEQRVKHKQMLQGYRQQTTL